MPSTPGLNVYNDGLGAGIVGATKDLHDFGVAGVNKSAAMPDLIPSGPGGVFGASLNGTGVYGYSPNGLGAFGSGGVWGLVGISWLYRPDVFHGPVDYGFGVLGTGRVGVYGHGTATATQYGPLSIIGVHGMSNSDRGVGVQGDSDSETGVGIEGNSQFGMAVLGSTEFGTGVWGSSRTGVAVRASVDTSDPDRAGLALLTDGDALIQGGLYVAPGFPKSALVKVRDGSHRALYCVESPESWFEDFGRARLVRGRARVRLDPTFAGVIRTGDYHVFLSPEGLSHGLYVSRRTREGFEVREQHRGTSTVAFSYRIVARRNDVEAPRFKRVKLPNLAKLPKLPKRKPVRAARPPKTPAGMGRADLERVLRPPGSGAPSAGGASRRRDRGR